MARTDWNIAKSNHVCHLTGQRLTPGTRYYSVLVKKEDGALERVDYSEESFAEHRPDNVYSYWKTAVPFDDEEETKKPVLDIDSVMEFFGRLEGEKDAQKIAFRYVLALMLTRKKVLKLKGGGPERDGNPTLIFSQPKGESRIEVVQPALDESEITAVSEELGLLLGLRAPEPAKTDGEDGDDSDGSADGDALVNGEDAVENETQETAAQAVEPKEAAVSEMTT